MSKAITKNLFFVGIVTLLPLARAHADLPPDGGPILIHGLGPVSATPAQSGQFVSSPPTTPAAQQPNQTADTNSPQNAQQQAIVKALTAAVGNKGSRGNPSSGSGGEGSEPENVGGTFNQGAGPLAALGQEGAGVLSDCSKSVPPAVTKAIKEAIDFRKACPLFNGSNGKIAINDYTPDHIPTMYVYDSTGTKCLNQTPITFGEGPNGANRGSPRACSTNGSHLTPPGFQITANHFDSAKYPASSTLAEVGLEGQDSLARSILIHHSAHPGLGVSWGCSGVGDGVAQKIHDELGVGSLVYNYFGEDGAGVEAGCKNAAGSGDKRHPHNGSTCHKDGQSAPSGNGKNQSTNTPPIAK